MCFTGNSLVDLSTAAHSNRSARPWVKFQSAGWVNIQSARTKQALKASISADFLKAQGWRRGPNGGILDAAGSTIYDETYVQAIKKVLANEEKAA